MGDSGCLGLKYIYVKPSCIVAGCYTATVNQGCVGCGKSMLSPPVGCASQIICVGAVTYLKVLEFNVIIWLCSAVFLSLVDQHNKLTNPNIVLPLYCCHG